MARCRPTAPLRRPYGPARLRSRFMPQHQRRGSRSRRPQASPPARPSSGCAGSPSRSTAVRGAVASSGRIAAQPPVRAGTPARFESARTRQRGSGARPAAGRAGRRPVRRRPGTARAPASSCLADHARAIGAVVERSSRTNSSRKARFSSTTTISSSPRANSRTIPGSSGEIMPSFNNRTPSPVRQRRVVQPEVGQRLAQLVVGLAGGDDARARRPARRR